jgi:transcriptional regulator with XRE-family HTH domain
LIAKNSDGFAERLRLALEGESVNAFARKCEISESLVRKYLSGAMPGLDKAVIMARSAGVSLDWLATGRGAMRPHSPLADEGSALDIRVDVLQESIAIVEEWLVMNERKMSPDKKAEIVAKLYQLVLDETVEGGSGLDRKTAHKFLRLVA